MDFYLGMQLSDVNYEPTENNWRLRYRAKTHNVSESAARFFSVNLALSVRVPGCQKLQMTA